MTGGFHSSRQRDRDRSLADRVEPAIAIPADAARAEQSAPMVKPCWLAPADHPVPAQVLGWVTGPDGRWRALVLLEADAGDVHPRAPTHGPPPPPA